MSRNLAHSYYDELPEEWVIEPIITTWREGVKILFHAAVMGAGIFLFLVALLSGAQS